MKREFSFNGMRRTPEDRGETEEANRKKRALDEQKEEERQKQVRKIQEAGFLVVSDLLRIENEGELGTVMNEARDLLRSMDSKKEGVKYYLSYRLFPPGAYDILFEKDEAIHRSISYVGGETEVDISSTWKYEIARTVSRIKRHFASNTKSSLYDERIYNLIKEDSRVENIILVKTLVREVYRDGVDHYDTLAFVAIHPDENLDFIDARKITTISSRAPRAQIEQLVEQGINNPLEFLSYNDVRPSLGGNGLFEDASGTADLP